MRIDLSDQSITALAQVLLRQASEEVLGVALPVTAKDLPPPE